MYFFRLTVTPKRLRRKPRTYKQLFSGLPTSLTVVSGLILPPPLPPFYGVDKFSKHYFLWKHSNRQIFPPDAIDPFNYSRPFAGVYLYIAASKAVEDVKTDLCVGGFFAFFFFSSLSQLETVRFSAGRFTAPPFIRVQFDVQIDPSRNAALLKRNYLAFTRGASVSVTACTAQVSLFTAKCRIRQLITFVRRRVSRCFIIKYRVLFVVRRRIAS